MRHGLSNMSTLTGSRSVDEPGARNNFLGTPLPSFGVTAGGYIGFFDPQKQDNDQVFGDDLAKKRSAIKQRALERVRSHRICARIVLYPREVLR